MLPTAVVLPERQWWPLSSKNSSSNRPFKPRKDINLSFPSAKPSAQNNSRKSSTMKFSTLTNAMGFKSKKHPPLAIQEPPPKHNVPGIDNQTVRYTNRPPAKSVSSTVQSWDDPIEPQTPSDGARGSPRSRKSMLSTPEMDPFSSGGIRFQPAIHDPTRLSVYSGASVSDIASKKSEFSRSSYSSSAQLHGADMSPNSSATSLPASVDATPASPIKRPNTRRKKPPLLLPDVTHSGGNVVDLGDLDDDAYTPCPSLFKSGSSSTLTERDKPSDREPTEVSSYLRPRGMTDGGSTWSPQSIPDFLRGAPPPPPKVPSLPSSPISPNSPRLLVRQASASRVGPPSTPPSRDLPAPPSKGLPNDEFVISPKSSSSSLSFASAVSSNRDPPLTQNVTWNIEQEWDKEGVNSKTSAGRTVKKAVSHQSFSKRVSNFSSTSNPSNPFTPADDVGDRAPRKQRSFHHTSRSILPSLPMPARNPPALPSRPQTALPSSSSEASPIVEQPRGSAAGSSGRKRLFSNGSVKRPSSQIFSPGDDDRQSVFTSEGEHTQGTGVVFTDLSVRTDSPTPSDGNEATADPPDSPVTATEYTPQMILSPAELAKLEASFDDESEDHDFGIPRQRVPSFASISNSVSEGQPCTHYIVDKAANLSSPWQRGDLGISYPLRHSVRSSVSQTTMRRKSSPSPSPTRLSFVSPPLGLPPPPRPRRQTSNSDREVPFLPLSPSPIRRQSSKTSTNSDREAPIFPLPPPPIRRHSSKTSTNSDREAPIFPLSPPPIRRQSSKTSTRSQPVRSIMKKPSFLEIEDEKQQIPGASRFVGSFLDLERGKDSFDTIRSENDSEGPG